MKSHVYLTCCVDSTAEKINAMENSAVEVTYGTFARHCDRRECGMLADYEIDARNGLTLKNDFMVTYYRSTYCDVPCYYALHSHINLIWVRREDADRLRKQGEKDQYARHQQGVPAGRVAAGGLAGLGGRRFPQDRGDPEEGEPGRSDREWAEPL